MLYKLFTKLILMRISRALDDAQPPEQAGFRQRFSCVDHIRSVAMFIKVCREYYLVKTNAILSALVDQGVDSSYIITLAVCYCHCSTTVQLFRRPFVIPIEKGVKLGDKLFTAESQWVMMSLNWDEKGIHVDGKFLSNLRFAEDIVIFAESTTEAETML
ncbi:unnamed protein product [Nippostrongylus brasiliensis]|uniref:Reverse transcriptase domain-containing protein n=1 Tax=Nippostrongylus brasiliensis TaxID=27835 RepID=A0A0N4YWZ6_NIPBR|nr:unnamed protein product [Nippostrongylus brasiliensis]